MVKRPVDALGGWQSRGKTAPQEPPFYLASKANVSPDRFDAGSSEMYRLAALLIQFTLVQLANFVQVHVDRRHLRVHLH
ncbi:hypothetical protein K227x_30640 [Rubripirellula lacrimiformis]|uniref:Uncharacterized protein n=1 Tax=Rubripirellula lacrimiformis TaxID=1930273 RepID=A0A517NC10_9BACT|nr:hypothetical protein K227x_30640 [Rubripirellula lacrimiformis]